jgi:hypothetical protein
MNYKADIFRPAKGGTAITYNSVSLRSAGGGEAISLFYNKRYHFQIQNFLSQLFSPH